ncbi:hypothetical protein PHMEG_00024349 [Phytophthora megakarya]|uniref:Copia type Polyprotein n=1 Tax=Phytophthora megakarya TaxID=4795 RepID=A0A225VH71_9STRA|nr:hypothetical protein PHMEG_00024349 [Phytophthora megakarya]
MQHIGAAKRLLRYLVGTKELGIVYNPCTYISNDPDSRKSLTDFAIRVASGAVSWASRRQIIVVQSTAEAEYVAACEACMGSEPTQIFIAIFIDIDINFSLGIDNQAAFVMASNPTYSRRTRHIELRWHYVWEQVVKKTVNLWKVNTDVNWANILTKPMAGCRHEALIKALDMHM